MRRAVDGDDDALIRAGGLFDLSDLPSADRDDIGRQAAIDLWNFMSRIDDRFAWEAHPSALEKSSYWIPTEFGAVIAERTEDGSWRFSKETRQNIAEMYEKVAGQKVKSGRGEYRDAGTWLRDRMPGWLRHRAFLLQHWQWLGLLALALLGMIAAAIGRLMAQFIGVRLARRRGVEIAGGRKVTRPFGIVAIGVLWMLGLQFLSLPEKAYFALMLGARFVMMVGAVWSLCRVADWVSEIAKGLASRTATKTDDLLVPMFRRAVKVFVVALGVVWIADNLDMDIAALLAGLGIGGIAIALAGKETVENFFGALTILSDRPFQVGDWIVMNDIEGTVVDVGFRATRVRTFYNSVITFPNAMLIRSSVDNLGAREYRRIKMRLGVTYDTPPDKLEAYIEGIRELIRRHPYTRKEYYHVYFNGFGDSGLEVLLYCFVRTPDWATELRERHRLLMDVLRLANDLGVEFAFPTRTLHMVESGMPEHGETAPDLRSAWKKGQAKAGEIVEEFTGHRVPPPVQIGQRPDEALDEGE
jgi:MscS family membrane protein